MSEIVVELDAYVIPDTHQVFKFSAGESYRFMGVVESASAAFLDIRGLDALEGHPSIWRKKDILKVIAADRWEREIQSRERGNAAKPGGPEISKRDKKVLNFVNRLFFEAKKGDILVIPPKGYRRQVLIGEISSDPGDVVEITAEDGENSYNYLGSAVNWRPSFEKREASADLLTMLHNPNAMITLGKTLRQEIYRWAYGNFVYDNEFVAEFETKKDKFTAEDHAVVSTWINGLDYLRYSLEKGHTDFGNSFASLGLKKIPDGESAEVQIDIQSPGEIFVRTATPFALVLMAFFSLSACGEKPSKGQTVSVRLKSVAGAADNTAERVSADLNSLSIALGDMRQEFYEQGKRASEDAKVTTNATLKDAQKESK